jgi:hypothetical protein
MSAQMVLRRRPIVGVRKSVGHLRNFMEGPHSLRWSMPATKSSTTSTRLPASAAPKALRPSWPGSRDRSCPALARTWSPASSVATPCSSWRSNRHPQAPPQ